MGFERHHVDAQQGEAMYRTCVVIGASAALILTGCSGSTEPQAASASPSVTDAAPTSPASPSEAPGRDAVAGPCPSRATSMTADEAAVVAGEPLTGEAWLPTPVATSAPAAAATAVGTWDEGTQWFTVGARGAATILAAYTFMEGVQLVEQAADGSLTWIANPFPADSGGPSEWTIDGVAKDAVQCYESLALPTAVPLVDGAVATVSWAPGAVLPTSTAATETAVGPLAGATLYRVSNPYPLANLLGPGETLPTFEGVTYAIKTPFGGWLQLEFNPLEGAPALTGAGYLTDYFDVRCADSPGYQALVPQTADADWQVVGTLNGRDVAVATASNPFAIERYAAYVKHFELIGDTETVPVDFATFLATPGVVGLRADDGGWWVQINAETTPRAWC